MSLQAQREIRFTLRVSHFSYNKTIRRITKAQDLKSLWLSNVKRWRVKNEVIANGKYKRIFGKAYIV